MRTTFVLWITVFCVLCGFFFNLYACKENSILLSLIEDNDNKLNWIQILFSQLLCHICSNYKTFYTGAFEISSLFLSCSFHSFLTDWAPSIARILFPNHSSPSQSKYGILQGLKSTSPIFIFNRLSNTILLLDPFGIFKEPFPLQIRHLPFHHYQPLPFSWYFLMQP